ncbi:hypothetical protein diail_11386, partial [Diaporthe ilicicola]
MIICVADVEHEHVGGNLEGIEYLLSELVELSEKHVFDHVMIESSGISEPGQVAEIFDSKLTEHMYQVLKDEGNLDEVIDTFTVYNDFNTADLLSSRRNDVTPEDERTVSDLMVDQIEFSDVIILNKTDTVDNAVVAETKALVRTMNREAKILCVSYGKVEVEEIVNTGMFSLDKLFSPLQDVPSIVVFATSPVSVSGDRMYAAVLEMNLTNRSSLAWHASSSPNYAFRLLRSRRPKGCKTSHDSRWRVYATTF